MNRFHIEVNMVLFLYPFFGRLPMGAKKFSCFCKGSSVRLDRIGDWNEEEVFINDNGVSSWTWELRM